MDMKYYDEISKGYDELYGKEQLEKLNKIKKYIKKGSLLDVGAGTGISTRFFEDICECTALDPSEEMLNHYNGKKVVGKAEELPFKDKSFDNVICVTALHHCDIDKAIKEMLRVVKKDGVVIVTLLKKSNKELNYEKIDIGKDWLYLIKH